MFQREFSITDHILAGIHQWLSPQTTSTTPEPLTNNKEYPASQSKNCELNNNEITQAIHMLRVDHSGEICAQALYHAQALLTRDVELHKHLHQAKQEETAHLKWCQTRLEELGGRPSLLNPVWAAGAYAIGLSFSLAGDQWNLGFLAETEMQVTQHLENQLHTLSERDHRTRAILTQMHEDEMRHGSEAFAQGGKPLPTLIKKGMRWTAKIMTCTARYI